jgi:hypothetical protein
MTVEQGMRSIVTSGVAIEKEVDESLSAADLRALNDAKPAADLSNAGRERSGTIDDEPDGATGTAEGAREDARRQTDDRRTGDRRGGSER